MSTYKLYVNDRNYSDWQIFETTNFNKLDLNINPIECKMFSNDVFTINDNNVTIVHSSVRSGTPMPGVLILEDNKTYGRQYKIDDGTTFNKKKSDMKGGKLLYKCFPDDMRLPAFLVPYEIKNLGFSKVLKNLYVTFSCEDWNDKHPRGRLDNVIGPVDILDNFYEYQLYCKSLNASIQKFQKATSKALESRSHDGIIETIQKKYSSIENRTDQNIWHVITIDPPRSQDFDDGFSLIEKGDGIQQLSIYVSNVTIWLDVLNLWDSFSRRISTIYLPDKKRPMLPTILSDCLCSLQENVTRVAFYIDILIRDEEIIDIKYGNAFIKVAKNYCYEDKDMLVDKKYNAIFEAAKSLSKNYKYINNVRNSHELVCYLMILMNFHCAQELLKQKTGIFRSAIMNKDINVPDHVPEEVTKFIKIWNSSAGQYVNGAEIVDKNSTRHALLDMDAYIHITSPIRRLVDLLNIIKLQQCIGIVQLSNNSADFYDKWLRDLEYINVTMRSIRKVQCDCTLLDLCQSNPETIEKEYGGYLFDKICRNDGLFQYVVFLPDLKLSSRITLRYDMENFLHKKFKLYLFTDEEKFKKKIRIQLL
jgi:exoribonuclease R